MDTVFSTQRVNGPYLAANDLFVLVPYIAHGRSSLLSIAQIWLTCLFLCAALLMDLNVHLKRPVNHRLSVRVFIFAPVIHSHEQMVIGYSSFLSDGFQVICEEKTGGCVILIK